MLVVDACRRDGAGGSPTVVSLGAAAPDDELARLPGRYGTSHLAVLDPPAAAGGPLPVRFFTSAGPLANCGHGTVAALAVLAGRTGSFEGTLSIAGREVAARARQSGDGVEAWFDQGAVALRPVRDDEWAAFVGALGVGAENLHPIERVVVASPGRERLLVPVVDREVLATLRPDHVALARASRRFAQLGSFVYVPPDSENRCAARMFAPAIGVTEDVANANSSGCLAVHRLATGRPGELVVEQGDALGCPSSVLVRAARDAGGHIVTQVGGVARVRS
ncbi:PhzF family phenazine biosynthesis protein [Spongisporangium articulatum]|uniref:PhzF family phenazine biosynthesis protein n=1 Tax=Spongisporangium articulatum TaxID=3362603 RepID=A0ABW8ALF2_9ACTN